ncbi:MAG TPA: HAD family hydrolase [Polyangiaceae bacterium]|nr:HAD family hydrolase [Polyangiaceae bacterium]
MEPARVVVFDFDGTLVHGDSVTGFAIEYLRARPLRLLLMLPFLPLALLLMLVGASRSAGVSFFWWLLTWGTRARVVGEALRTYTRRTLAQRGNGATLAALADHDKKGDLVIVATAAPASVVHHLLRARGLPPARVVGTLVKRRFGGLVTRPHCIGAVKVRELERRLGITRWAEVYSDSALDLPLMRQASAVILVEPNAMSRSLVERALAGKVPVRVLRDS